MKKNVIAIIITAVLLASCASKPTLEQRFASDDAGVVNAALDDLWRLPDEGDGFLAAVALLDKKEFAGRAAVALSRISTEAVDNIILRGMSPERDNTGRLFYFYLISKKRTVASKLNPGDFTAAGGAAAELLGRMMVHRGQTEKGRGEITAGEIERAAAEHPLIAKECVIMLGYKGSPRAAAGLEEYGQRHPEMKPYTAWAQNRIRPVNRIKYALVDRVIINNPYWEKSKDSPVMPAVENTFKSWHTANPDILVENGMIYFYYRGGDGRDRVAVASIPYESFDGMKFQDYPGNPVIDTGRDAFDDAAALDPAAVYLNKKVFLYYSGLGKGEDSLGLAVSDDFYNFSKYKKNPVMEGRAPEVVLKDGLLYLFYVLPNEKGGYSIHLATSRDGYNFVRYGNGPVFSYGDEIEWDSKSVTVPRIREKDGVYYMFYAGDDLYRDYPAYFGVAFSYDLVTWHRGTQNPVFSRGQKGEWDDGGIWYAEVFPYKGRLYMYYEGWGGGESHEKEYGPGGRSQIGLAVSGSDLEEML